MFQFQPFMALVLRSGGAHQRIKQEKHLEAAFTASWPLKVLFLYVTIRKVWPKSFLILTHR